MIYILNDLGHCIFFKKHKSTSNENPRRLEQDDSEMSDFSEFSEQLAIPKKKKVMFFILIKHNGCVFLPTLFFSIIGDISILRHTSMSLRFKTFCITEV